MNSQRLDEMLQAIGVERARQEQLKREGKFPWSCEDIVNPDTSLPITLSEKLAVLAEEFGEVANIVCKLQANRAEARQVSLYKLQKELVQVAAVACAWAESLESD